MIKSTRKCPHRLAYCLILWKDFLKWESLFSEDSSLCHWEKKSQQHIAQTNTVSVLQPVTLANE